MVPLTNITIRIIVTVSMSMVLGILRATQVLFTKNRIMPILLAIKTMAGRKYIQCDLVKYISNENLRRVRALIL